jgi:hypothetical protein
MEHVCKYDLPTTYSKRSLIGIQCNKSLERQDRLCEIDSRGFRPCCVSTSSGFYLPRPCLISRGVNIYSPIIEARSIHGLRVITQWYKQTLCHMECTHVVQWHARKHCCRILAWAASSMCLHISCRPQTLTWYINSTQNKTQNYNP